MCARLGNASYCITLLFNAQEPASKPYYVREHREKKNLDILTLVQGSVKETVFWISSALESYTKT